MDITLLDRIKATLNDYLTSKETEIGYKVDVVTKRPKSPVYPLVVLTEARNQTRADGHMFRNRISSVGYMVRVFAKEEPAVNNQELSRLIAYHCDLHMSFCWGFRRTSKNEFDADPYETVMLYSAALQENRQIIF
jgi:hypothetical protein